METKFRLADIETTNEKIKTNNKISSHNSHHRSSKSWYISSQEAQLISSIWTVRLVASDILIVMFKH